MTDDQVMHALGVDLDEIYGSAAVGGAILMGMNWKKAFDSAAESLGLKGEQLSIFPRGTLVEVLKELNPDKPINPSLMLAALAEYVKSHE